MAFAKAFRSHDDHYNIRNLEFRRASRLTRHDLFGQESCVRGTSNRGATVALHLTSSMSSFAMTEQTEDKCKERTSFYQTLSTGTQIGVGSFGKVYRMTSKIDPRVHFAVKIIPKHHRKLPDDVVLSRIHNEVNNPAAQYFTCWACELLSWRVTVLRVLVCRWISSGPCSHVRKQCG